MRPIALLGLAHGDAFRLGGGGGDRLDQLVGNLAGYVSPFAIGKIRDATGSMTLALLMLARIHADVGTAGDRDGQAAEELTRRD